MSQIHQQNRNIRRGNARNTGRLADVDRTVQVQLLFRLDAQALDLVVIDILRDLLLFHLLELLHLLHLALDVAVVISRYHPDFCRYFLQTLITGAVTYTKRLSLLAFPVSCYTFRTSAPMRNLKYS